MKRVSWFVMLGILMILMLAGCGEKTQEDVLEDLGTTLEDLSGYKAKATMQLETGNEPQTYDVEVWYQKEGFYRVVLNNKEKDQSQIILRNDDGVFVLTPALNKSFRFQSDWPKTTSQSYLYESLVADILTDQERTFSQDEEHYLFETATNYQNKNLNKQQIYLNKKDLTPARVEILDAEQSPLVTLNFTEFEKNASFNDVDFEMEQNMTGAQLSEPTLAEPSGEMEIYVPLYVPDGTSSGESKEVETEDGTSYVQQYTGENSFTLIQKQTDVVPASTTSTTINEGQPVDLGFTIGVQTEDATMWSHNGIDFYLASTDLDAEEMANIARSVYGTLEK
ncbi:outer membrane lipoprotein-sorting protein [Alkalicoccobacillus murimartini]|uniref:Outer membrane lipoprotein-sorting protein n=1 Tax=Alkalicoccobacillus murimartini TaxID=171685 RepID=A0ABT9YLT9_9BACI|nr:outer membrane lipoprotein-sorting protein [Alkalicoccobacillus murimartini]MDQ0208558.1 outer membrane lipoprotein-sorting protein [Alkalicoccobacillus murimartini]